MMDIGTGSTGLTAWDGQKRRSSGLQLRKADSILCAVAFYLCIESKEAQKLGGCAANTMALSQPRTL